MENYKLREFTYNFKVSMPVTFNDGTREVVTVYNTPFNLMKSLYCVDFFSDND
jgi:hypothetical protein